jgi:hypothetical protein
VNGNGFIPVRRGRVQEFVNKITPGRSGKMVENILHTLTGNLRHASKWDEDIKPINMSDLTMPPKEKTRRSTVIEEAEVIRTGLGVHASHPQVPHSLSYPFARDQAPAFCRRNQFQGARTIFRSRIPSEVLADAGLQPSKEVLEMVNPSNLPTSSASQWLARSAPIQVGKESSKRSLPVRTLRLWLVLVVHVKLVDGCRETLSVPPSLSNCDHLWVVSRTVDSAVRSEHRLYDKSWSLQFVRQTAEEVNTPPLLFTTTVSICPVIKVCIYLLIYNNV